MSLSFSSCNIQKNSGPSKHKRTKKKKITLCLECEEPPPTWGLVFLLLQCPGPLKCLEAETSPLSSQWKQSQDGSGKIVWHHDLSKKQPLSARLLTRSYPLCFLSKSSNCCSLVFLLLLFIFIFWSNRWGSVGGWWAGGGRGAVNQDS